MQHTGSAVTTTPPRRGVKEDNRLRPEDRPAHNWYRFVLSFPPHLVREYLDRFEVGPSQLVLDPFCGTGTTLVECRKLGIPSIGVESNPVACFASRTKVNWNVDPEGLLDHARLIAQLTSKKLEDGGISEGHDLPLFRGVRTGPGLRGLPPEVSRLLLRNSISPLPLHKTLVLLDTLVEHRDERFAAHEQLALAKALIFGIGNLHFGPEVGVGSAKEDAPVVSLWLSGVRAVADDLRNLSGRDAVQAVVHRGDARQMATILEPNSVDAVITSPPYPNEKDYTRTTRLESVLLGFVHNRDDLRSLKKNLVRSNTRGVYRSDGDDLLVADNEEVQRIAEAIERRRRALGKTSGFERLYARVTKLYFGGMAQHLLSLRGILRSGAHLAYVVGDQASYLRVMIRTGRILADIAHSLGYEVVGIDLFRTRLSTVTKEQLREEVVLLRKP